MKTRKSSGHTSRLLNSTVSHEKLAFLTGRPSKSKSVGNQRTGKIKKKIRAVARKDDDWGIVHGEIIFPGI